MLGIPLFMILFGAENAFYMGVLDLAQAPVAFATIGIPMGKNILIAYFLLNFITLWNNYETPLLYFNDMPTLALGLYAFQQEIQYAANYPAYFAGALIAMLPILLIFVFAADKLMGQMYSGGLKG